MNRELLRQPKAVWAVAFACVISFMGIGLVDPILPEQLDAGPSQVSLLFTSYVVIVHPQAGRQLLAPPRAAALTTAAG